MKPVKTFSVLPALPEALLPLRRIATDVHWAWNHDAIELLRRLDPDLWEESGHNPVLMLGRVEQERLDEVAGDPAFMAHLAHVARSFDAYEANKHTWFQRAHPEADDLLVAYFSAEFGLTECLSIFAGGLGILAGDHLKSASDLGVPLVGVGLLYQEGYFQQRLNEAGWQQENYRQNDFYNLPIEQVIDSDDAPLTVEVPFPNRAVIAYVWRVHVGRITLYLLDCNHPENSEHDREITRRLYGGDVENRLRQEIVLGVGGVRALEALDIDPTVYHMNEGHSAFLVFEWIRQLMEREGIDFATAREAAGGLVFTTHTPVAAGHDYFSPQMVEQYLGRYAEAAAIPMTELLALGRQNPHDSTEVFCNTVMGLRTAGFTNAVSRLHGEVTRHMWSEIWPGIPEHEIPIGSITNGVHLESWISMEQKELYDRYLGPQWREEPADGPLWSRAAEIPASELWRARQQRRHRLVDFARRRLAESLASRGAPQNEIDMADVVLDPHALTIGFSRRFATYKRATLLLRDTERLARILTNEERPVQIIFAGKAHPDDEEGKKLIRSIISMARHPELRRHIVFIADYDMAVTRYLVQGADIWLNTPVRPLEASGTSGMKAAANGVLNLSTLDGWWDEAYEPDVGWAIGRRETYSDPEARDEFESLALYDLIEHEAVPLFYDRGIDGFPRRWIERVQLSIAKLNSVFNTHRMVREYTERYYLPAAVRTRELQADGAQRASSLADWKRRVEAAWEQIRVLEVSVTPEDGTILVNQGLEVEAQIQLGDLEPTDVTVELYQGRVEPNGEIAGGEMSPMDVRSTADGICTFAGELGFAHSGRGGFTVRILPNHPDLAHKMLPGLVAWA